MTAPYTFKRFDPAADIVVANPTEVTVGLWPGDTGSLVAFYTGSQATGSTSREYYWNVYNKNPYSDSSAEVCFAVAYGHRTGAGHPTLIQSDTSTVAPKAVYSQYRNLLLDPTDEQFTFYGDVSSDNIYIVNIQRSALRQRLDPGNWQLKLSGSNGMFTFIDSSGESLGVGTRTGEVFYIVSGTIDNVSGSVVAASASATQGGYGLCYPSLGLLVFNPAALIQTVGFSAQGDGKWSTVTAPFAPFTGSTTSAQYNHAGLYYAIKSGADFQARSAENIASTHYFVRMYAPEFNYSNNPTFYDETNNTLTHAAFQNDPRTYPTTVGLYNDGHELLAVAKLSQPVQKGFDKEINVKVRLDF